MSTARTLLLAACCLMPAAPALAKEEPDPVKVDAAFDAAAHSARLMTASEAHVMKAVTRVAVPQFAVEFVTADSARAETSGFGAAGRASAAAYYKLVGVSDAEFQSLTDALYADFLRDLKAAGYEVVAPEQLAASASYRKLLAGATPSPLKADGSLTLAPSGMALYGMTKATTGNAGKSSIFGAISAMANVGSAIGAMVETTELHKELQAAIVEVQMKVHFVQLTNNNKGFLGRLANSASVDANVFPRVVSASMGVQTTSRGQVTLNQPLALDAAAFAEVKDAPTTAADVAGGIATALIRLAANSKDSSSSVERLAVADPVRWREVVGGGLGSVRTMFVMRLRAER